MKMLKKWFQNFLKDLEKANKETFGDKRPDCCGLNSTKVKAPINPKRQK